MVMISFLNLNRNLLIIYQYWGFLSVLIHVPISLGQKVDYESLIISVVLRFVLRRKMSIHKLLSCIEILQLIISSRRWLWMLCVLDKVLWKYPCLKYCFLINSSLRKLLLLLWEYLYGVLQTILTQLKNIRKIFY